VAHDVRAARVALFHRGRVQSGWWCVLQGVRLCWCVVYRLSAGCSRGGHCRVLVFGAVLAASGGESTLFPVADGGPR